MTQRKITGSGIANDAITADNIATGAVTVADINDGEITSAKLEVAVQTKLNNALVKDSATGAVQIPSGTTAQRPGSPASGDARFNTDSGSLEFYDGTTWISTNLIPTVDSVTGTIYADAASSLTVATTNATDTVTVRFSEGGSTIADVDDVDMSSGSASVAVPASVYGQTAGDTITVSVINQDGTPSSNAINKTVQPLPTGGTVYTYSDYRVHAFTSSSSFSVPSGFSGTVDYLLVAGGGGCGDASGWGGGGGAGGVIYQSAQSVSAGSYSITIGSGGAPSNQGGNTTAFSLTAIGGGRGGDNAINNGGNGGSGGGGRGDPPNITGGSGTAGQGNAGGAGFDPSPGESGGGGGGAGSTGQAGSSSSAGNGGQGVNYSSVFGTNYGESGYFASGGGGSIGRPDQLTYSNSSESSSSGWAYPGGGGTGGASGYGGGANVAASNGQANTGGGCGAGSGTGSGGSGIVIIRYQL